MDKNKLILKRIIAVFTAFILAGSLSCLGLCITAKLVLSPDFTINIIDKTNYVDYAKQEITEELSDLAIPSGLPANFFDDKIAADDVSQALKEFVNSVFSEENKSLDLTRIQDDFKNDINLWANENFVTVDEAADSAISLLAKECYYVVLRYSQPEILRYIGQLATTLSKFTVLGIIFSLLLCLFTTFFLFKLLSKKRFFFLYFVSFCSGGLLIGVIPLILLVTNKISSIAILSKSLYAFVCGFANGSLIILTLFGLLFLLFSFVFVLLEKKQK